MKTNQGPKLMLYQHSHIDKLSSGKMYIYSNKNGADFIYLRRYRSLAPFSCLHLDVILFKFRWTIPNKLDHFFFISLQTKYKYFKQILKQSIYEVGIEGQLGYEGHPESRTVEETDNGFPSIYDLPFWNWNLDMAMLTQIILSTKSCITGSAKLTSATT